MAGISALDCDYFSDSYSCVFRQCSGYQAPFPIVRLGRVGKQSCSSSSTNEQHFHPCIALSQNESNSNCTTGQNKCGSSSEAYLLHLKLGSATLPSCVSFLQLMVSEGGRSPVRIVSCSNDAPCVYFKELEEHDSLIASVCSRTARPGMGSSNNAFSGDQRTTGIFWKYNEERSQLISSSLQSVFSVALSGDGGAWCLAGAVGKAEGGGCAEGSVADESVVMRFDQPSLFSSTSPSSFAKKLSCVGEPSALSVEEMDPSTVAVFSESSAILVDARESSCGTSKKGLLNFLPYGGMWSASLASHHLVTGYSRRQEILVFDCRKPTTPTNLLESSTVVGVKSNVGEDYGLLVGGEQVAVVHFSPFSVIGAVQVPGIDSVLDAAMTSSCSTLAHLRVSTVCGMVYDWSVSH